MTDEPAHPRKGPDEPEAAAPPAGVAVPNVPPFLPDGTQVQAAVRLWQSVYPPPEAAERFERLCPGAFDRMLKMAEQAQRDQTASSHLINERQSADNKRGAWLGFAVTVLAMAGAAFSVAYREPWVAGIFLGLPVLAVAKSFIGNISGVTQAPSSKPADKGRHATETENVALDD